ncbi:MAG: recombination protein RecR [Candidatus Colwellbacteria bacterium]|nr:recombination protein RecR [Candidatus Colwellbacteria bacterium]
MKNNTPESLKKFAEVFATLPGIGPRQAIRLAFYLASRGEGVIKEAATAVEGLSRAKTCKNCFFVTESDSGICEICSDKKRDAKTVALIEKETDLITLEESQKFKGKYFILGDLRKKSGLEAFQKARLENFISRIKKEGGKLSEIIIAVNPNSVASLNAAQAADMLKPYTEKISRIGIGIPSGGEIEFADQETLGQALERRT